MHLLEEIMIKAGAQKAGLIKYEDCDIINYRLAQRLEFEPKSVCIGIVPYYTRFCDNNRTVSSYAVAEDYHRLLASIGGKAVGEFSNIFTDANAIFFGDHSPINEKLAAAKAGLGIIGRHSLLITPEYSSYVFLCELITDIEIDKQPNSIKYCDNCGACMIACPGFLRGKCDCISHITQRKGLLTENESKLINNSGAVWGCDICQEACPYTLRAIKNGTIYTSNPFFNNNILLTPTSETISNTEDFSVRAYSWRGKETILRNIDILNGSEIKK